LALSSGCAHKTEDPLLHIAKMQDPVARVDAINHLPEPQQAQVIGMMTPQQGAENEAVWRANIARLTAQPR
jgi:hypothetical protein